MKVGDIVVNPWVSKIYNNQLNPNYATIYIGNGNFIDCDGRIKKWCMDTKVNKYDATELERVWKIIGHINIKKIIKEHCEVGNNNE